MVLKRYYTQAMMSYFMKFVFLSETPSKNMTFKKTAGQSQIQIQSYASVYILFVTYNFLIKQKYKIPYIGPSFQSIIIKINANGEYLFQISKITKFCKMLGKRCETEAPLRRHFTKFSKQFLSNTSRPIEISTLPTIFQRSNPIGICISFVTSLSPNWAKRAQS